MYFAARINSFIPSEKTVAGVLTKFATIPGLTHVDFNYPEHFKELNIPKMRELLREKGLSVHGLAMRFRGDFINGEFGNNNPELGKRAEDLTKEAIDACMELGGENVTIWLGYDGFDYSFQVDYPIAQARIIKSLKELCVYAKTKGILLSIEYKPYEPRAFSLIDSFGMVMYIIEKVGYDNLGLTLDFCHMLMKKENPAYGLSVALENKKIHAIHLNDGYGRNDDGLIIGSAMTMQILEFIYYLKKYSYNGMIYFDTFPVRENPEKEILANIEMFQKICAKVDRIGIEKIGNLISENDAVHTMNVLLGSLFD